MVVYKIDRAENDMVMNVSLVYVGGKDVFILPLCYRVGKLLSDFMGFLIIDFPPNYFGDLIKKETGKTAQEYIQCRIIELAKERILEGSNCQPGSL